MIQRFILPLVLINVMFAQDVVYWEPEVPVPGGTITIYYNAITGTLPDNTAPVYIHLGFNGWQNTSDYAMTYAPDIGNGWWSYAYNIPENAETIDFVFTDLQGNWDNNGGMGIDWHISLNYYWTPFNPKPSDVVSIVLNNVTQGGEIAWTVEAGNGHVNPIETYWPNGSYLENGNIFSPLEFNGPSSYKIDLGPFLSGEQIVYSIKFRIRWDDGSWDVGSNGQIIYYDIYLDYNPGPQDPYVFFISPTPFEGAEVEGPVAIAVTGTAQNVEFWANGELIGTDNTSPFEATWNPDPNSFGESLIVAIAVGESGVTYLFRNVYLLYTIVTEPVPAGVLDGVNIEGNTVTFALYAPFKDFIAIKGSWNSQYTNGELMKLSGDTLWWYQTDLPIGDYTYQYNVAGEKLIADPWSKDVTWVDPGGGWESGNYQQANTAFTVGGSPFVWNDQSFSRPIQQDVIVYELHIGDFRGQQGVIGTYQDVIDKLEAGYFDELGITAIELMPVNEFEGDNSWGYNPSFYMAPESTYGTPDDLRRLVDVAHQHGIAVLLDVVFNHMWGSAPLFQLYQPVDSWDYQDHDYEHCPYFQNQESQWGYKLQHWHEVGGRQYRAWKYVSDALLTWVNDYHIDGFRFDATWGLGWGGDANGASFYADLLDDIDPGLILIAEEDNPSQVNNSDFDAGWDFSYHHTLFNNLMEIYLNMYDVRSHLQWWSQSWSSHTAGLNYIESHDEGRLIYEAIQYQGMNINEARLKSKLGATALLTGTGTPMLYHGQEFGQNGTSHSGGSIIPQPLQWNNLDSPAGADQFDYYKGLIWLRNNWEVIRGPNLEVLYINNTEKVITVKRNDDGLGQTVYVVMNFSNTDRTIDELPFPYAGVWYEFTEDVSLETVSGSFANYFIPASTAKIYTNYRNWGTTQSIAVDHLSGWNMVGLPLSVDNAAYEVVFPGSETGTLYGFDGSYFNADELVTGNGYWLYFNSAGTDVLSGNTINSVTISLTEGWNLISGISAVIPTNTIDDPGGIIVPGTIYGFDGSYFNTTTLNPGRGYWINASADGDITLTGGAVAKERPAFIDRTIGANTISFNGLTLYFGVSIPETEKLSYSLPPKPPVGAFACPDKERSGCIGDVRFKGDSKISGESGEIVVISTAQTLAVLYNVKAGEIWYLTNVKTGEEYLLESTGEIQVNGNGELFTLIKKDIANIPDSYGLFQNHPNPFNPVTTIAYQLPRSSVVKLSIFNLRGQLIETLINESKPAGNHSVLWNADKVGSGVYFYRITAGNYSEVKKCLVVK